MDAKNSMVILNGCIESFKKDNELTLNESEIFELFSLYQIMKKENLTFENIADSITDGGNDGGIDSIIVLHNDEYIEEDSEYHCKDSSITKLIITQCKTEKTLKESTIDKLIASFPIIFNLEKKIEDLSKRFNVQIINKISIIRKLWQETMIAGGKIEICINYACKANEKEISESFKSKELQLLELCQSLFSTEKVDFNCYTCKELLKLFQIHKKNRLTLNFKETPLSVNYDRTGLGYIGLVRLSDYRNFLTINDEDINEELFESNVRDFQGNVDVNNKIIRTLENITDRDFWWLNNGITIIAENPRQLNKDLTIEHVQIVNGLQTSYSIFNLINLKDNDERSVLVKVIITDNKNITDDIIEATNYQNAVSPGLLRATDALQKEIELYFIQNGYYYDRRKNYYKNQGKPGNKIFSISYLAQAIEAICLQNPHLARATPTSLLKNDGSYKSIFKINDNYKAYLNCCLIISRIHYFILNFNDKQQKNRLVNFKYHLAMIATLIYLNKLTINIDDISQIDIKLFDDKIIYKAISKIEECIDSYQKEYPDSNIINIAKSLEFTLHIKKNLSLKFDDVTVVHTDDKFIFLFEPSKN